MLEAPTSCPFAPRCRFQQPRCTTELPLLRRARAGPSGCVFLSRARKAPGAVRDWRDRHEPRRRRRRRCVEVENLRVWFPITSGLLLDRHVGDVKAVDGVSLLDRARRDGRTGRRVGLRQVDARPRDPPALQADRRTDHVRRPGHHEGIRERAARGASQDADGVPGSVRIAQSAAFGRPHRRRAAARAQDHVREGAATREVARAARGGRTARRCGEPVSARVLRRAAAAHRDRPRAGAEPGLHRLRRARLGARRLDPGADHQPARGRCRASSA